MIEAIFFDFGGVVSRLDRDEIRRLEQSYGLQPGDLISSVYAIPEWRDAETGRCADDVWIEAANRTLDERAGRPVPELHEKWRSMWRQIDEDVVGLARSLGARYRVAMISNSTLRLEKDLLEPYGLHELFEAVINSARVGIAKPDVRIYHHAAERLGVDPAACVHIDDLAPNIEGAMQAGFSAVHYEGDFASLTASLRALGVEW